MHYYGTYAMARAAGISPEACQIIATAAEFVDDNGKKEHIPFPDGGRLDFVPTAHHMTNRANKDVHDQRLVWLPFHFIPGNIGDTMHEKLVCQKDSDIVRELVENNKKMAKEPFRLYLIGITAHVYADTFAHYGFSGISSPLNRIDQSTIEILEPKDGHSILEYIEDKASKFSKKFAPEIKQIFDSATSLGGEFAEDLTAGLGHAGAYTYPDRPYMKWQFEYEHPKGRPSGVRDNLATFLEACEKLHAMFLAFVKENPDLKADEGRPFDEIRDTVSKILNKKKDCQGRSNAWKQAARKGDLFYQPEEILPYLGESWEKELEELKECEDSKIALEKSVYRFFQAAAIHRTYVLRELLPSHDIVAD